MKNPQVALGNPQASWPQTGAACVALAALFLTAGGSPLIALLALALLWTHFTAARLEAQLMVAWVLRLALWAFIAITFYNRPLLGTDWVFDARAVQAIGQVGAVEIVLQAWRRPAASGSNDWQILLAGVVFLCGCNTIYPFYVPVLTPFYVLCTLLALRQARPRAIADGSA